MSRYKYKDMTGKPHNCEDCIHNDKPWYELPCDACCTAHSGFEPREKKMSRYIDAENLMKALEEDIPITDNPIEVMASVIATLEEQPTADVIEIGKPYFYEEGYILKDFHNDGVHRYFVIERAEE